MVDGVRYAVMHPIAASTGTDLSVVGSELGQRSEVTGALAYGMDALTTLRAASTR